MEVLQNMVIEDAIISNQLEQSPLRRYINAKQQLQHIPVVIVFLILILLMLTIIPTSIFLSINNYNLIGLSVNSKGSSASGNPIVSCQLFKMFVTQNFTACTSSCTNGAPYLQKYCISHSHLSSASLQSTQLDQQISIHNLKTCFNTILYCTAILLIVTLLSVCIIIALPSIFYCYIFVGFAAILGLAFYLLKNQQVRQAQYPQYIFQGSIYFEDQIKMRYFGYILFVVYLLAFPIILFSYNKIQKGVQVLTLLKLYYKEMIGVQVISLVLPVCIWGLCMFQIFVIMTIYSSGQISIQPNSFLYAFTGTKAILSHPGFVVIHAIRIYWLYGTLITWHQHLLNASVNMWYFSQNQKQKPLKRSLKKSRKRFGAACISSLLIVPQWIIFMLNCLFPKQNPNEDTSFLKIPQQKLSLQKTNNSQMRQSILAKNPEIQISRLMKTQDNQRKFIKNQHTEQILLQNTRRMQDPVDNLDYIIRTDQKAAKDEDKQITKWNQPISHQKLLQPAFFQSPNQQILNSQQIKLQVKNLPASQQAFKRPVSLRQPPNLAQQMTPNRMTQLQPISHFIPGQNNGQPPLQSSNQTNLIPNQTNSIPNQANSIPNQANLPQGNNQQNFAIQNNRPQLLPGTNQQLKNANQRLIQQRKACHKQLYNKICNGIWMLHCKANRLHSVTGLYPNLSYVDTCQKAACTFQTQNGRFSNIGAIIRILLTFVYCSLWILFTYILMNSTIYGTSFPPVVSSLTLPIIAVFITSLIVGSFVVNIIAIPIDSILFDFLIDQAFLTQKQQKHFIGRHDITQTLQMPRQPILSEQAGITGINVRKD